MIVANGAAADESVATAEPGYLALGDSYTIGEGVEEHERWPVQLAAALRAGGMPCGPPVIIAETGWTTDELEAGIDAAAPAGPYRLVTLLIGVNNQYRGREASEYAEQLSRLVCRAIEAAGDRPRRVVLVSIPDYGITPFIAESERDPAEIARQLDRFNAIAARVAAEHRVRWVDITPLSRQRGALAEMLAEDGLHPSGAMYRLWMRAILPHAELAIAGDEGIVPVK
jgi:lysophospholipase L1-like esterase